MQPSRARVFLGAIVLAAALVCPRAAEAQPSAPSPAALEEARNRFDQGTQLFNEGNPAGALPEFQRAYELTGNHVVLFNIGLVYAAMNRSVEAVDALEKVLSNPADLTPEDVKRAVTVHAEQLRRIASVTLDTPVQGAVVEVDDVQVGKTPLGAALRMPVGTHRISVIASGFHPFRTEVTVAGGETRPVRVELVPTENRVAKVSVASQLLDAEVLVDGQLKGRTPLTAELLLEPGTHLISVRRDGYRTADTQVTLVAGSTRELALNPEPDPAALSTRGERVELIVSESDPTVVVDGLAQPGSPNVFRLLPGRHTIRVQRVGFMPVERIVTVSPGSSSTLRAVLAPTPEQREQYVRDAETRRIWSLATVGAGALVGAAGGVFLYFNTQDVDRKQRAYDAIVYASEPHQGRRCDPFAAGTVFAECNAELDESYEKLTDAKKLTKVGWATAGVGAAAVVAGVVLLLTGDDPARYDHLVPSFARTLATPVATVAVDDQHASFRLTGAF
ncbi:MAG: PEGA domain-containing protein [Polyangiaceae bacterium]|nr:PEGA domain-containing protein [Polyangiaceae bacterium]